MTKDQALRLARSTARALGRGWKADVKQVSNGGWTPRALSARGHVKVHAYPVVVGAKRSFFTCYIGSPDSPGGLWVATEDDPRTSYARARAMALKAISDRVAFYSDLREELRP